MRTLRRYSSVMTIVAALAALPAVASTGDDAKLDTAPAGLSATTVKLSAILAAHDRGTASTAAHDTIVEDWAFSDTGVVGTEHLERSGSDYRSKIVRGSLNEEFGQLDGKRWHQDANGNTSSTTDIDDKSFLAVRVREDAADPKNDVSVIGETSGTNAAYVVQIKRSGYKHPEWVFYDERTGAITRVEHVFSGRRIIETYDDFRTVDGVTQAWHMHDSYSDPVLDDDWHITAFHAGMPLAKSAFFAPASHWSNTTVREREALDGQVTDEGYAIVRMTIGGRGLDFEIDSSQSSSFIDRDVAQELGLTTFGQATHLSSGKPLAYETVIPDAQVGSIHLHNFAVVASYIAYRPNLKTKVVGYLGADFLANNVIHIDYPNRLVEAFPPAAFGGSKPVQNQIEVPMTFDDGIPFVPMIIGDGFTKNVVLNSDLPITLVFGPYVNGHSDQFQDMEADHHRESDVPFADEGSFGQRAEVWWSRTSALRFAIANYEQMPILTTNFPYNLSGKDIDAMLGLDYLRYFDLYFDFPHQRFIVVPNKWFYDTFKKNA